MTQRRLPFKYEEEKKVMGLTSFGGIFVFLELVHKINLFGIVHSELKAKSEKQGWDDFQLFLSILLLNLCNCDSVDDIEYLENDSGLKRSLLNFTSRHVWGKKVEKLKKRWRKVNRRSLPSSSSIFRFLELFHNVSEEQRRDEAKAVRAAEIKAGIKKHGLAFIPAPNEHLCALSRINQKLLEFKQLNAPQSIATLDMDAILIESNKKNAYAAYKNGKGYQPLTTWWAEQKMIVHSEFRDGNVPAGYEQRRVLEESLDYLPAGVKKVYLRSDTAGYQWDLLKYCANGKNKRFGCIEFAVGCDVTEDFRKEVAKLKDEEWRPIFKKVKGKVIETGQWAEVPFVPNAIGHSKNGPDYRFLAIRKVLKQRVLPGMEDQMNLPFPTMSFNGENYKLFGVVTNMNWEGERLIHWHHKRCGDSEHIHSEMRSSFCGGRFPSGKFGANAAWWTFMVMAINLTSILRSVALTSEWQQKRMKGISLFLIRIAGRIVVKSRELIIRISGGHSVFQRLLDARRRIESLCTLPSG